MPLCQAQGLSLLARHDALNYVQFLIIDFNYD